MYKIQKPLDKFKKYWQIYVKNPVQKILANSPNPKKT